MILQKNRCVHLVHACLVLLFVCRSGTAQWFIQSQNYGHMNIGYNTTGYFDVGIMENGRRFNVRMPGLTNEPDTVSFEAADYPGMYMRHYGYKLFTEHKDNPRNKDVFNQDATFKLYVQKYIQGYYSFESVNYPGHFIRHMDSRVQITNDSVNGDYFPGDCSWRLVQPYVMLQPRKQDTCGGTHCKIAGDRSTRATVTERGHYFRLVSPGPSGNPQGVGFEVYGVFGYYLRDYGQVAYIDAANTSRSPYTFLHDATFVLKYNYFSRGYYAIESEKNPNRFLRVSGSDVRVDPMDGSAGFATEASFRFVEGPVYLESKDMSSHKIGIDDGYQAVLAEQGYRFNLVYPGLTTQSGSVSFESYDLPGYFLRHISSNMDLESIENPRNPGIFEEDATFFLRRNIWFDDYIIFESVNYINYSIRHGDNDRMVISMYENSDDFKGDSSYTVKAAPLGDDGGGMVGSGSNAGAIVGYVFLALILIAIIVVVIVYTNKKFAWISSAKMRLQRGGGADQTGGVENPSYPPSGFDQEAAGNNEPEYSTVVKRSESTSSRTSAPKTPTTPTDEVFGSSTDQPQNGNPVKRLSRSLSNSMSKLKRSLSNKENKEERQIEVPQGFDISVKDFQPGPAGGIDPMYSEYGNDKGSFGNPMYGLQQLPPSPGAQQEASAANVLDLGGASNPALQRNDSILDNSPTLEDVPADFDNAMNFFDNTIDNAAAKKDSSPKEKKKISAGISPIDQDDLWDINDA